MAASGATSDTIFVARLARDTVDKDLQELFSKYGKLTRCDIKGGRDRCYAFIQYEDRHNAEDCMKDLNGMLIWSFLSLLPPAFLKLFF